MSELLCDMNTSTCEKYCDAEVGITNLEITNILLPKKLDSSIDVSGTASNSYEHSPSIVNNRTHIIPTKNNDEETIDVPILQRQDNTIFILITFPTYSIIKNINCITNDLSESIIQCKVYSPYGITSGSVFDYQTKFLPGDYCIGLAFNTLDEANKVTSVKLHLILEQISNLMVAQMIFGLYHSLGFEPSHVLKYPVKSVSSGTPFYRKTRGEINQVSSLISALDHKFNDVINKSVTSIDTFSLGLQLNEISNKLNEPHHVSYKSSDKSSSELNSKLDEMNSKLNLDALNSKLDALNSNLEKISSKLNLTNELNQDSLNSKLDEINSKLNQDSLNSKLDEINTKLNQDPINSKLDEINTKLNQDSLNSKLDEINTKLNQDPINSKLDEINTKLKQDRSNPKLDEINSKLQEINIKLDRQKGSNIDELNNKLDEISIKLDNTNYLETDSDQFERLQNTLEDQFAKLEEMVMNKESDIEKGSKDIQSMTVSDLEKLLEERDAYFNKLFEAEEHIDYLQKEVEEAEGIKQEIMNKRTGYMKKKQMNPQWM